ncbi:MAG TPA: hypothetical protein VJK02_08320 [Anaerolineales bacterium]|nr:hypothetical protein [Anaerolineales bacterium]
MLILLPVASFVVMFLDLLGERRVEEEAAVAIGGSFLRAAVLWGAFVAVSSEVLSVANALTRLSLSLCWLAVLLASAFIGWKRGSFRGGLQRLRLPTGRLSPIERITLLGIAAVAASLLVVAWISPPNNVDSLLYHISRVVHWAQDQSLRHYATAQHRQLLKPIWAESAILDLRLLWGSDRPANLVQWFSMVGSIVGAVSLAALLGAGRAGRLLTAAFVISIPMGILQSTSTQNDYVAAFWAICAAFLVVQAAIRPPPILDLICLALVLGIGFLTKGTYYVYAPLFVVWYFLLRWRQTGFRRMAMEGIAIAALACALNLGFWARNVETFGGPYGTSEGLQRILRLRLQPSGERFSTDLAPTVEPTRNLADDLAVVPSGPEASGSATTEVTGEENETSTSPIANASSGRGTFLARVVRTATFNLATPVPAANEVVLSILRRLPTIYDDKYISQWRTVQWNHEDTAPSPLHFLLILTAVGMLLLLRGGPLTGTTRLYALAVLGTYLLIPVVIGHGPSIWGIRYQLPFFVLGAPILAWAVTRPKLQPAAPFLACVLVLLALPWLLFNNTRPLVGLTPWLTRVQSILRSPQAEIEFAMYPDRLDEYQAATRLVREAKCDRVGLRIDSHDPEYLLWWLLQSPQSGIRIETIYTPDRLQQLIDPEFHPCAILCTICSGRARLHGLPLAGDFDRVDVFLGPGFVADPDG